jgi:CRP/FNR family transcriptional regulator, cyclic AMP receptor protein
VARKSRSSVSHTQVRTDTAPVAMELRHSTFKGSVRSLKQLPPFSWLSNAQLERVLPTIQYRTCPARMPIVNAGDKADGLYILLSGRVLVIYQDPSGHELVLSAVGPHEFFGELGLLDAGRSCANVQSLQPCEILFMPRQMVLECLEGNPRATVCMLRKVVCRLRDAHHKMASFALTDVYERVTRVILDHGEEVEGEWRLAIGSEQIAAMVGSSREMVTRVVRDLIARGVVRRYRRTLILVDRKSLPLRRMKRRLLRGSERISLSA